jgi:hypothetical protein
MPHVLLRGHFERAATGMANVLLTSSIVDELLSAIDWGTRLSIHVHVQ